MTPGPPHWAPGWLTIGIAGAAGFLLGVVVLVVARGVVHDDVRTSTRTHTIVRTRTIVVKPKVPNVVGLTVNDADAALRDAGYNADVTGGGFFGPSGGDAVQTQDPAADTELPVGSTVTIDVG